ncbi:AraC family transcriptional regulator [Paucibacter sp. APW11]|uniref:AraC family transcriptional regulator n=1 Tax=Roseateles aquae TaxID=3077235 RepID=A0ABU3PFF3_9BURK|nr:AraC family transcriptional regulator [Paucibacter sp. APW11]MDT9001100.1 AraC family transcriptional regulator [Paucibacter sp. APW11]
MCPDATDSSSALKSWFVHSGVRAPLETCIGPLPGTGAGLVRWSQHEAEPAIRVSSPHPDSYRIAVMLEPLESQIWVNGEPFSGGRIAANSFRICPPGSAQRWRQLSACDIANVFIPTSTVDSYLLRRNAEAPGQLGATPFLPDREVLDLVGKMLNAEAAAGPLAETYCDAMVAAMLSYLLEQYGGSEVTAAAARLGGARLRRVQRHMQAHLGEEQPIAELAQLCAMSASHFAREFSRAVGLPPHQYLLKLRLERAAELLAEGDDSLLDIALACGFNDASHFSRAFTRRHGQPPSTYRRALRERRALRR